LPTGRLVQAGESFVGVGDRELSPQGPDAGAGADPAQGFRRKSFEKGADAANLPGPVEGFGRPQGAGTPVAVGEQVAPGKQYPAVDGSVDARRSRRMTGRPDNDRLGRNGKFPFKRRHLGFGQQIGLLFLAQNPTSRVLLDFPRLPQLATLQRQVWT